MKRYADYTKDDLMLLLESLTPGGSEFHESPATCIEFVRARYAAGTSLGIKRGMAEKQRDSLLAACEAMRSLLDDFAIASKDGEAMGLGELMRIGSTIEGMEKSIAAAKGEA